MKKIWIGILLTVVLTGMSACRNTPEESTGESAQIESAASSGSIDSEEQDSETDEGAKTGNQDSDGMKNTDTKGDTMKITAGNHTFTAVLADNSSEENRIPGVAKFSRLWLIPKDAEKPADKRKREENTK